MSDVTRDELAEFLFTAQYPEGFWVQGYTSPREASNEEVADAILSDFTLTRKADTTTEEAEARYWAGAGCEEDDRG